MFAWKALSMNLAPFGRALTGLSAEEFALVRLLRHRGPSRSDQVAAALDLTRPTCARLVSSMASHGWIAAAGHAETKGGRPPVLWDLVPGAACVAGLTVEIGRITAVVADLAGTIIAQAEGPFTADAGSEAFAHAARSLLAEVLGGAQRRASHRLLGVSATAPGLIDSRAGTLGLCTHYRDVAWWPGFPLVAELRQVTSAPIYFDRVSNVCALGEHWFGPHRGVANMLYVTLATEGVGVSMLVEGQVHRGAGGRAGEFGHMTVERNGRVCRCGNAGCLDTYVAGGVLVRKAQELRAAGSTSAIYTDLPEGEPPHVRRIVEAALAGDRIARRLVEEAGQMLGIGLANLVNLFNPGLIVIGGELAAAGDVLRDAVAAVVERRALEPQAAEALIVCSSSSSADVVRGTIATVLHETFGSPAIR
jgi:predicted NBD/HSP70 family sugar kinase